LLASVLLGKIVSGLPASPVNRWLVGWCMVPRGEVSLKSVAACSRRMQCCLAQNNCANIRDEPPFPK